MMKTIQLCSKDLPHSLLYLPSTILYKDHSLASHIPPIPTLLYNEGLLYNLSHPPMKTIQLCSKDLPPSPLLLYLPLTVKTPLLYNDHSATSHIPPVATHKVLSLLLLSATRLLNSKNFLQVTQNTLSYNEELLQFLSLPLTMETTQSYKVLSLLLLPATRNTQLYSKNLPQITQTTLLYNEDLLNIPSLPSTTMKNIQLCAKNHPPTSPSPLMTTRSYSKSLLHSLPFQLTMQATHLYSKCLIPTHGTLS